MCVNFRDTLLQLTLVDFFSFLFGNIGALNHHMADNSLSALPGRSPGQGFLVLDS